MSDYYSLFVVVKNGFFFEKRKRKKPKQEGLGFFFPHKTQPEQHIEW